MKSLNFAAMENVQGGSAGNININIPLTGLLSVLNLGGLLGAGLSLGIGISYNITDLTLPTLPNL